ncbi:MAG TPA: cupin, partial [Gammaproteobacteria bacterium]|nr:cupin [Gammaproteobacteria bacterium]
MAASPLNPPDVVAELLTDDGTYPNNPALPLLIYRCAFPTPEPDAIEAVFAANGWPPAWRFGVFGYHHYHSTAHEALGCFTGSARIQFGGPEGPVLQAGAGDVVILPAGTAHKC